MAHFFLELQQQRAVVVERQTRYLEGVVPTGREGSNPSDRIAQHKKLLPTR